MFLSVNSMLQELEQAKWLANLGKPVDPAKARVLPSWHAAYKVASDETMVEIRQEHANRIRDGLYETSAGKEAYQRWNELVDDVKPDVEDMVHNKLDGLTPLRNPQRILDALNWTILHACMEIYYRQYTDCAFFQSLCEWLVHGHLPVGWEAGDYPEGRAVIY